jgi:hypothetical protein
MRSKQDILDKKSLVFYYPDRDELEGPASVFYEAMDEYAKEVAITYLKDFLKRYRTDDGRYPVSSSYGEPTIFIEGEEYPIEKTFDLFILKTTTKL